MADENIDPDLVFGLRRRFEQTDIVRVQDVGLRTLGDRDILGWAASENRILISHDLRTIPRFAAERLIAGLPMPGVILLRPTMSIAEAIDELAAIAGRQTQRNGVIRSPTSHLPEGNRIGPTALGKGCADGLGVDIPPAD